MKRMMILIFFLQSGIIYAKNTSKTDCSKISQEEDVLNLSILCEGLVNHTQNLLQLTKDLAEDKTIDQRYLDNVSSKLNRWDIGDVFKRKQSNPTSFKLIVQSKAQIKYAALYRILLRLENNSNISDNSSKSAKKSKGQKNLQKLKGQLAVIVENDWILGFLNDFDEEKNSQNKLCDSYDGNELFSVKDICTEFISTSIWIDKLVKSLVVTGAIDRKSFLTTMGDLDIEEIIYFLEELSSDSKTQLVFLKIKHQILSEVVAHLKALNSEYVYSSQKIAEELDSVHSKLGRKIIEYEQLILETNKEKSG